MTNFRKTVVTFVLRLYLFLKDSIATLARILQSTQPSAPRTYSVGSDGSIRTLRPLTGIVQVATNEVPRLILPVGAFPVRQNRFLNTRLLYYRAIGRILVIQERGCYHVFVGDGGEYLDVLISSPVGNLEQAPTLIDDVADSGVAPV